MKYKIKYGSLEYDSSITEEIYNDLIACAEMQKHLKSSTEAVVPEVKYWATGSCW